MDENLASERPPFHSTHGFDPVIERASTANDARHRNLRQNRPSRLMETRNRLGLLAFKLLAGVIENR